MNDIAQIRKSVDREIFDYQQLLDCLRAYSKPRDKIRRLVAQGDIIRVKKGLYSFAEPYRKRPVGREWLANLIYGPSYISLDYALYFHGLIPERIETVTSVALGRSRRFETPFGLFTYQMLPISRYVTGAMVQENSNDSFFMAAPEKALVDKVWTDNRFAGTRISDFESYLLEDLRLDPEELSKLNKRRLEIISNAYNTRKIRYLIRCLESLTEVSHA